MFTSPRKLAVVLAAACLIGCCTSCRGGGGATAPTPAAPTEPTAPTATRAQFDSQQAMKDIQTQCDFGSRTPGSAAHANCKTFLLTELAKYADRVISQDFTSTVALGGATVYPFTNIIGVFAAKAAGDPIVMLSHWDSRPVANQDPTPANRTKPILGANDGASGVAVLLELARVMKVTPPNRPVIILFVDAEDAGTDGSTLPYEGFCVGTMYYANHLPLAGAPTPKEGILLDMVGSLHDFELDMEQNSLQCNPALVDKIWTAAAQAPANTAFRRVVGAPVIDDHMPLNDAGIKSIDIIHWHPVEWHTLQDTPANCSAASLYQVGDTLLRFLYPGT
jgi:hypothetical protein